MVYETARLLSNQSYQHWVSYELFSLGWFVMVGVLAIVYTVWLKIVDKRKLTNLLLLGSLCAVGFGLADIILEGYYGLWEYKIRIFPLIPTVFITSYTIGPILFMTVAQYTTSWKTYIALSGIGAAVISFGIMPIYGMLGIIKLHNFNHIYGFTLYMTGGIIGRAIYLWISSIEQRQPASRQVRQEIGVLQPVTAKPLTENHNKEDN